MLIISTYRFYSLHSWNDMLCVGVGRRAGWIFIPKGIRLLQKWES